MRPRDMARVGHMMLKDGKWKGRQIVSPAWVRESTQAHVQEEILLGSGYGYQWWRGRTAVGDKVIRLFFAAGRGGQYIFVCPELDLVTVFTSKTDNDSMGEFRPQIVMAQSIIPAALPASPPRSVIPVSSKTIAQVTGDYRDRTMQMSVTIFNEDDRLFFKESGEDVGRLFASSDTRFFGASDQIGDFQGDFFKDQNGDISHFVVQVGFGFWRFDRIER